LAAYEWQHNYIAEKAGLCQNLPVGELKKIAEQSGMCFIQGNFFLFILINWFQIV